VGANEWPLVSALARRQLALRCLRLASERPTMISLPRLSLDDSFGAYFGCSLAKWPHTDSGGGVQTGRNQDRLGWQRSSAATRRRAAYKRRQGQCAAGLHQRRASRSRLNSKGGEKIIELELGEVQVCGLLAHRQQDGLAFSRPHSRRTQAVH